MKWTGLKTEVIPEKKDIQGEIKGLFETKPSTERRMPLGRPRKPVGAFK